jgi:uncharacterized protein (DUF305 family)
MQHNHSSESSRFHYLMFGLNMILSLIVMYFVMFSMVDGWGDFRNNINMFYMALTMLAPMGIIMLATMGGMYRNRKLNLAIYAGLTIVLLASFTATRQQTFIGDRQFIASMVPHHSGAILMCREASISDAELRKLCGEIIAAQRREIEQMDAIRRRLTAG